uniref:Helicase ATP-binding domain-containing protein n=1 Tax=Acrobeloides nanus TaxID=290746 RepID=A0A914CWF5_9BILA
MHSFQMSHVFVAGDIILGHIIEHHMEKILEVLNQEWDVVILDELFGMHAHTFAMILNRHQQVPYIVFSTTLMVETTSSNMALSRPWTSKPCMFSPIPEHPQDRHWLDSQQV